MDWAHIHLAINHLPVWGVFFGLLFSVVALFSKSSDLKKWSLWFVLLISVLTIPVYLTGEPAEELIEHLPGVTEAVIEKHEKSALFGTIVAVALGLVALVGILKRIWNQEKGAKYYRVFIAANVAVALIFAWIANLGGKILHSEIGRSTTEQNQTKERTGISNKNDR